MPGPDDAIMGAVVAKYGYKVVKEGGKWVVSKAGKILRGADEADAAAKLNKLSNQFWERIADLKQKSFDKLDNTQRTRTQTMYDRFQQQYCAGTGTRIHEIPNVRNLQNGLFELKDKKSGLRIYLDAHGNILKYGTKGSQDADIKQLQSLIDLRSLD